MIIAPKKKAGEVAIKTKVKYTNEKKMALKNLIRLKRILYERRTQKLGDPHENRRMIQMIHARGQISVHLSILKICLTLPPPPSYDKFDPSWKILIAGASVSNAILTVMPLMIQEKQIFDC